MNSDAKSKELEELRQRVRTIEAELAAHDDAEWPPKDFYLGYYATTGFLLGGIAAGTSLLVNVIAAPIAGKNALELVRIYLTFPLGERALSLTDQAHKTFAIPDGMIIALGCCLYLATGMLLGVPLFVALMYIAGNKGIGTRLVVATGIAVAIWLVNFYGILSWLQPRLFGGNWITDNNVLPWWVAGATHLVFGWTMALLSPLGTFQPYRSQVD